jgi:tRNA threonylcarbamoyladenosine modification (KEOPS) complex Cgi121 subunit
LAARAHEGETEASLGICAAITRVPANSEDRNVAAEAYCVKCKTKRQIKDAVQITMKNGRPATEGKCPECGTKMFKIGAAG